jgi:hypothetical protein
MILNTQERDTNEKATSGSSASGALPDSGCAGLSQFRINVFLFTSYPSIQPVQRITAKTSARAAFNQPAVSITH